MFFYLLISIIIYLIIGAIVSYWSFFIQEWGEYFFTIGNFIVLTILWLPMITIWFLRKELLK